MMLNPEMYLMVYACIEAPGPKHVQKMNDIIHRGVNWETFISHVRQHRLFGPVHKTMSTRLCDSVPSPVRERIRLHAVENVKRSLRNASEAIKISKAFNENGIEHLFLKGLCLSQQLYGNPGFRHAGDIDLIIPDKKTDHAMAIMEALGYRQVQTQATLTPENLKRLKEISHHVKYTSAQSRVSVEIHWRFYKVKHAFPISFDQAFRQKTFTRLHTHDLPVLSDTHTLIFLFVHGAKHAWQRFVWLKDVHDYFFFNEYFDRKRFFEEIAQLKLIRPVAEAFGLLNVIYGIDTPEELWSYVQSHNSMKKSMARIFRLYRTNDGVKTIFLSYYHKMFTLEGLKHSIYYVWAIVKTKRYKKYFNPDHPSRLLNAIKRVLPIKLS